MPARRYGSPTLTRMLARMNSSLTEAGPTCLMSIFEILAEENCPRAGVSRAKNKTSPQRRSGGGFIVPRSVRHVFVAYFGCAFESRIRFQKRQTDVAGRPIALLGDQQIHRHGFLFRAAAGLIIIAARLVEQTHN